MKFRIKILITFLSILLCAKIIQAQQIKATARLDSTNILIGDQIKLFLEIDYPENVTVEFPIVSDTLSEFIEVLERSKIDTIDLENSALLKQIR